MSGRFTSEQLKKIAMGTMFIDHASAAVIYRHGLDNMSPLLEHIGLAMRLVGRMAFPLYAFLLVQGFLWTRDWKKYVSRMLLFVIVSEVPFDLVLAGKIYYPRGQNTIVTLTVGLICLKMLEVIGQTYQLPWSASAGSEPSSERDFSKRFVGCVLTVWVLAASMAAVSALRSDYGAGGLFLIVLFYLFRYNPVLLPAAGMAGLLMIYGFSTDVFFAWIAIFFISRYNGERGRKMGLLPYIFYPAHLLAVWLAGWLISGI